MIKDKQALQRRIRPSVPVTLEFGDEKISFNLSFDFNTLARIEEKTGLKTLNIFTIWIEMSASVLGVMFWAAVCNKHPEYDDAEGLVILRSMLDPANADRVADALWKAYMLFLPVDKRELMENARAKALEEGEKNPTEPPPAIAMTAEPQTSGSDSGPSQDTTSGVTLASSAS